MKKKVLSLALALAMCLGVLSGPALAAEGDFTIEDGILTKYNGPGGHVIIPDGVTGIGMWAFRDCDSMTGVTIPDSVTSIGLGAFWGTGLTSVTIPDSVTSIENSAFLKCANLTSVVLPAGITSVKEAMFQYCAALTDVTIPDGVTSIEGWAFYDCGNLTSVTIPASVTSMGQYAFHGDTNVTDVYYGGSPSQWEAIEWADNSIGVVGLSSATVHYNAAPSAAQTAYASTQSVLVDGKAVEFFAYALKDANGNDTNYVKLRDVAQILNGSAAQFEVGWDGTISITTGAPYTSNGSELVKNFEGNQSYTVNASPVKVNGVEAGLEAITLTDSTGGGFTYFKLRDLGTALGFTVDWNATDGIIIKTK